jgi:D-glycero-D-manno-heptose 1,7-bisphosphate phosphatase
MTGRRFADEISPARPALFLDRDGVINVDHGYVYRPEEFEFVDGIFELVSAARQRGLAIVVVTNQAGIGRGLYSEEQFQRLTAWMCTEFSRRGADLDRVYHSPTHPVYGIGEYRREDFMRKPNPGMILRAQAEMHLDLRQSTLVGDKVSDIDAGLAAGVGCNLLFTHGAVGQQAGRVTVPSLREVVPYLANPVGAGAC